MKKACLIMTAIMVLAFFGSVSAAETLENPTVCTWKDNKTSAVSIRIDDGIYDSAVVYNQLQKKYGVKSTQMMITNTLVNSNGSYKTDLIAKWQAIFDDGYMDLGNHSYTHAIQYNNTDTYTTEEMVHDITGSYNLLRQFFPNQEVLFFAPPWGHTKGGSQEEAQKNHYALTKSSTSNPNKSTPKNMFLISAVTSTNTKTVSDLTAWIDDAVTAKGWQVILFHGIETGDKPATYETLDENVEGLFKYMKEKSDAGDVWSGSLNDVVKYIYERDSATVKLTQINSYTLGVTLTDTMADNEIFDYPLTVKVNVPSDWQGDIKATQGTKTSTLKSFDENGKKYVYADIIPDGGEMTLAIEGTSEVVGETLYLKGPGIIADNSGWIAKKDEIKKVEISDGLAAIGEDVFAPLNSISEVLFAGTYNNWKAVDIKEGNDALLKAEVLFTDGTKLLANANGVLENVDFLLEPAKNSITTEYALSVIGPKENADSLRVFMVVYNANGKMLACHDLAKEELEDRIIFTGSMTNQTNYKLLVWAYPCSPVVDYITAEN